MAARLAGDARVGCGGRASPRLSLQPVEPRACTWTRASSARRLSMVLRPQIRRRGDLDELCLELPCCSVPGGRAAARGGLREGEHVGGVTTPWVSSRERKRRCRARRQPVLSAPTRETRRAARNALGRRVGVPVRTRDDVLLPFYHFTAQLQPFCNDIFPSLRSRRLSPPCSRHLSEGKRFAARATAASSAAVPTERRVHRDLRLGSSRTRGSAPAFASMSTTATCPPIAAWISGVCDPEPPPVTFGSAFASRRTATMFA